ncbi:lipid A biosynthesis acyltransferase [Limnohabitans sp. 2KL-1]|jgi:KDO2-lipid IV(A) lauroyltransferase|uniref:LpxL/LpxP family acyltransferase n=1 Tax=Limnohabitans sp. 2KL-1 TaxID=1100699 RepID=UPI001E287CE0|nr:lipid A biosynthesis acyltransferase [Limnohabitans sp. 2KL-1]
MHPLIVFMRLLAPWPLAWVRGLGWVLGHVLYALAHSRRHIVQVNLSLCFPDLSESERQRMTRRHMVGVMQSLLDRSWLWHGSPAQLRRRLQLVGDVTPLQGDSAVVMLAPHFVGLDAGGTALTMLGGVQMASIYVPQSSPSLDDWVRDGRNRSGAVALYYRHGGVKPIVSGLRKGDKLYLLPDMDFGPQESLFVPFFGVQAATVPSLSRFSRLGRAQVVTVATRMTPSGYSVEIGPVWTHFPSEDVQADTERMNRELQALIATMPEQYYWVHKRFKTRPEGEPGVY